MINLVFYYLFFTSMDEVLIQEIHDKKKLKSYQIVGAHIYVIISSFDYITHSKWQHKSYKSI